MNEQSKSHATLSFSTTTTTTTKQKLQRLNSQRCSQAIVDDSHLGATVAIGRTVRPHSRLATLQRQQRLNVLATHCNTHKEAAENAHCQCQRVGLGATQSLAQTTLVGARETMPHRRRLEHKSTEEIEHPLERRVLTAAVVVQRVVVEDGENVILGRFQAVALSICVEEAQDVDAHALFQARPIVIVIDLLLDERFATAIDGWLGRVIYFVGGGGEVSRCARLERPSEGIKHDFSELVFTGCSHASGAATRRTAGNLMKCSLSFLLLKSEPFTQLPVVRRRARPKYSPNLVSQFAIFNR